MLSTNTLEIRNTLESDLATLSLTAKETWRETYPTSLEPQALEKFLNEKFSIEHLQEDLKDKNTLFISMLVNQKLVGYTKIIFDSAETALLDKIYILKSHQQKGYGSQLLMFALQQALNQGRGSVWLTVFEENTGAIEFYKKSGFNIVGEKIPYVLPGKTEYDYKMACDSLPTIELLKQKTSSTTSFTPSIGMKF